MTPFFLPPQTAHNLHVGMNSEDRHEWSLLEVRRYVQVARTVLLVAVVLKEAVQRIRL